MFIVAPELPQKAMPPLPFSVIGPLQMLLPPLAYKVERMSPLVLEGNESELLIAMPPWTATRVPVQPAPPVVLLTTMLLVPAAVLLASVSVPLLTFVWPL